ncbi:MAG: DUF4124 domain-containing protein [Telluria sp.]
MKLFIKLPFDLRVVALFAALGAGMPATAGELYKCVAADGKVTYSGTACKLIGNAGTERALVYPEAPPPGPRQTASALRPSATVRALPVTPKPSAVIRLFYDPADAPMEHPVTKVEAMIRRAVSLWTAECAVYLDYAGTAPKVARGSPDAVSIFWMPALAGHRHPAHDAFSLGGYGSLEAGIAMDTRKADDQLAYTIMHEMGHVLGLKHIHEDRRSVMSYMRDDAVKYDLQPMAGDYLQCNWAIKKRFGVPIVLPAETPKRGMSDKEAVKSKYPELPPMAK